MEELTDNERENLLIFLDRVPTKGFAEAKVLLHLAQKIENRGTMEEKEGK